MRRLNFLVLIVLIVVSVMHDFFFLNFYNYFGGYFYLNLWKEVVLLVFIFATVGAVFSVGRLSQVSLFTVVIVLVMMMVFLAFGGFIEADLRTLRSFFMPLFFALILSRLLLRIEVQSVDRVLSIFVSLGVFCSLYAFYQFFFVKDISDFWYFAPLQAQDFELKEYNSFRDGSVRISGFFTSSLEFSFFMLFIFAVVLGRGVASAHRKRLLGVSNNLSAFHYVVMLLLLLSIAFSTVRSSYIGLSACVAYYLFLRSGSRLSPGAVFLSGIVLSFILVGGTFFHLSVGGTSDLSALGRLVQWSSVIDLVREKPFGWGLGFVGPGQEHWYDSLVLNMLATMGVAAVPILSLLVWAFYKICVVCKRCCDLGDYVGVTFSFPVVVFFPTFIYLAFFQAMFNAQVVYLFFIFLFFSLVRSVRYV